MRRIGETIHLTALGVWLGALIMTGAAAAITFPMMRDLDPALGAYPDYTGEHWSLGAGVIADRIFLVCDIVQFVCAFLAFATLGWGLLAWIKRSIAGVVRTIAVGLAMAMVSYWLFIFTMQLDVHLDAYWAAAAAGDNEGAATAKSAFDAMHPLATKLMGAQAALVLVALVSGCVSAIDPRVDANARS